MLEPMRKERNRFADAAIICFVLAFVIAGFWLCSEAGRFLTPDESDCIEQLHATTRKTTNYTEAELVSYGRCLLDRRE